MIAIPNMDKPKSCDKCPTHSFTFGNEYVLAHDYCGALKKMFNVKKLDIDPFKEILPDCPLIEIIPCKECIYNTDNTDGDNDGWCYKHGIDIIGFCSEGEKK